MAFKFGNRIDRKDYVIIEAMIILKMNVIWIYIYPLYSETAATFISQPVYTCYM